MLESILAYMSNVGLLYVYLIMVAFALTENLFPPSPSDVIVIVAASLLVKMNQPLFPALVAASFASSLGFMIMYAVGQKFGLKIVRSHRLKFIKESDLEKADKWFNRYGYKLILVNRFLPGTRSIVSFFSGLHNLDVLKTFVSATISAFLWNIFIFWLGYILGANVKLIDYYLNTYTTIGLLITAVVILVFVAKHFYQKRKLRGNSNGN
jgi:membrane protein DedA with SNARE-associated domain